MAPEASSASTSARVVNQQISFHLATPPSSLIGLGRLHPSSVSETQAPRIRSSTGHQT